MAALERRKYEFLLVIVIIGVLALVLMNALERTREDVEEAAMQAEVAALRVELLGRLAHRETFGGALPESRNPLRWVDRQPPGYLGELDALDAAPLAGGVWYFDTGRQELVYRFRQGREGRFRLVRGAETKGVKGVLGGVGLRRTDGGNHDESAK